MSCWWVLAGPAHTADVHPLPEMALPESALETMHQPPEARDLRSIKHGGVVYNRQHRPNYDVPR